MICWCKIYSKYNLSPVPRFYSLVDIENNIVYCDLDTEPPFDLIMDYLEEKTGPVKIASAWRVVKLNDRNLCKLLNLKRMK